MKFTSEGGKQWFASPANWILNDDNRECLFGSDDDFAGLRSDSQEPEIVGWFEIANRAACVVREWPDELVQLDGLFGSES